MIARLSPGQTDRYQDATSIMLRQLVVDYSEAESETTIAYYCSRIEEPYDRPELWRMTDLASAKNKLNTMLARYVSRGASPTRDLSDDIARRENDGEDPGGRRSAAFLRRVLEHMSLSLAVGAYGIELPSSDDLGPYPRSGA